jgi:hypothetical protein
MGVIEEYVRSFRRKKARRDVIRVVLYDSVFDMYLFLFNFNWKDYSCTMLSSPGGLCDICEMFIPFIDQLDHYYGDCTIIKGSVFEGKNYKDVQRFFEKGNCENTI